MSGKKAFSFAVLGAGGRGRNLSDWVAENPEARETAAWIISYLQEHGPTPAKTIFAAAKADGKFRRIAFGSPDCTSFKRQVKCNSFRHDGLRG